MWKIIRAVRNVTPQRKLSLFEVLDNGRRFFLSDAFRCQEAWEQRLEVPILKNLKLDDMYYELDQKFQNDGKASVVDIDLFANAVKEESFIDELEDLIHKLRLSPNTVHMLPSTPHALIRTFLSLGKSEQLLRILNDRINYGIFPDDYCLCLLMDTFIKDKNYTAAAKVSALQMLQEDWSNPLIAYLALYSCHMFLNESCHWEDDTPVEEEPEEEIKIRVKYIRNPYFDDHFDLRDPKLLVGKTLASVGTSMPNAIGRTYHLIGLGLYKKWDKAITLLQQVLNDKQTLFKSGVKKFEEIVDEHFQAADDSEKDCKTNLSKLLEELISADLLSNDDLHEAIEAKLRKLSAVEENILSEKQRQLYLEWESAREVLLKEEMEKFQKLQRLTRIQKEKEELELRERELFYFDNEDKLDLIIEKNEALAKKYQKGKEKKKVVSDEDYIPPQVK